MEVSVTASPLPYSATAAGGYALIIVSVKNPRSEPVWLALTPEVGQKRFARTFEFSLGAPFIGTEFSTAVPFWGFMPGETKRRAFDAEMDALASGTRTLTAKFNGVAAAPVNFVIP